MTFAPVRFIPRLAPNEASQPLYLEFLDALLQSGFKGDVTDRSADRTVFATDNSIFQVTPQAIAFPNDQEDVVRLMSLAGASRWREIKLAPRGGGTGTNGQSLTGGLVVDLSRHMNHIIGIDAQRRRAVVQAGVVKDQLNSAVRSAGLFFAPELSTSNRATIGGMVNTDASGQGSIVYGKTHDHVLALKSVLLGGDVLETSPMDAATMERASAASGRIGKIHRVLEEIARENVDLIAASFPTLTRNLTGYDLVNLRRADGTYDLNAVLCGSEGTLSLVTEATINLLPIPRHSAIVAIRYRSFDAALRHAQTLMSQAPTSIEALDATVMHLARGDRTWPSVKAYLSDEGCESAEGVNLVEYASNDAGQLSCSLARMKEQLARESIDANGVLGYAVAAGEQAVRDLWEMRKRAVGMLGKMPGPKRPVPFVEDTAVPPERLADYIAEFRSILDGYGLRYGMFGHVDAGVLHVRPALDLTDAAQHRIMRKISDQVAALTTRYGGVLWGEHGKGFRSKYVPDVFGPVYPLLQEIKAAFDPHEQLNPGKIASAHRMGLIELEAVQTRGSLDNQIAAEVRSRYETVMACNGNGACYNFDVDDPMCPSWKATRERRHSPKGRASLMREWLRRMSAAGVPSAVLNNASGDHPGFIAKLRNTVAAQRGQTDFSHDVMETMRGCLACKACATQCPVSVDVPAFRAKFIAMYYTRYLRPIRDHVVGNLEFLTPWMARAPNTYNVLAGGWLGKQIFRAVSLIDVPELSPTRLQRDLKRHAFAIADVNALRRIPEAEREKHVIVVQDTFTSHFDVQVLIDTLMLLRELGFNPHVAPYRPNGKALHVHGFLSRFKQTAIENILILQKYVDAGVSLVGIEPATTLAYRDEYKSEGFGDVALVPLIQEWLLDRLPIAPEQSDLMNPRPHYRILAHCTERAIAPNAAAAWAKIFSSFGASVEIMKIGCCGMAGTFGHETEHRAQSETLYGQSWKAIVEDRSIAPVLSDGFSCRSQAKRFSGKLVQHPVSVLRQLLIQRRDGDVPALGATIR